MILIGAFLQSFLASLDLVLYVLAMVPCGNMIDSNDWISGWCSGVRLIRQVSYRGEPLSWSSARSLWKNSSLQWRFRSFVAFPTMQGFRFTDLDQLALWGVDRKALSVRDPKCCWD